MHRVSAWLDARSAPVVATVLLAIAGLGYALLWATLAHRGWHSYSDLWNSAGLSLSIGHGHWSAVYAPPSQLDAPPGFEFLLAPVMVAGHALGLATTSAEGTSYKAFGLILAPVATVMAASVLFALDAVARRWGYSEARRLALALVAGLGVVSAAVFWGHPEDCIALALVVWAALAVDRDGVGGLHRAGWLLGLAIACQPLALLAVAPVVARFGWRELRGVAWRLALPTVVVILPELIVARARTLHAVVDQPYFPPGESSTPFGHFARSLGNGMYSGGTLRLVATLAAVVVGLRHVPASPRSPDGAVRDGAGLLPARRARERTARLLLLPGHRAVPAAHVAEPELVTVRCLRGGRGPLRRPREPAGPRRRPVVAGHHGHDGRHDRPGPCRLPAERPGVARR